MKKIITLLLAVCVTLSWACAEDIDLSGLSYDQLVILRDRIDLAIWESDTWQEVTVPQGIWAIGEDIPAGAWTIRPATDHFAIISIGNELTESGVDVDMNERYTHAIIVSPDYKRYDPDKDIPEYSFTFAEGDYIVIEQCSVIFSPYAGKPDLGFI